jgi:glycosyltransferase involved in cell wall biosynthesis
MEAAERVQAQPISRQSAPKQGEARHIAVMNETVGIGGAEWLILHLVEELRSRGRRVTCVLPEEEGWLSGRLEELGVPMHRFRIRRMVDLECVDHLTEALGRDGVEAIHSHEFAMSVYGTAVAQRLGCPHVITMHGNQTMLDRARRRVALRWAIRHSRAAVAVSGSTRDHLLDRLGPRTGPIQVIRNGIPHRPGDRERTRAALGIRPDQAVLLGAGSLVERKGFHVLVDALALLRSRGSSMGDWKLLVAGEGSFRPVLEERIAASGVGDRIELLGYRLDVPDLQAAADIFVMPSLWEGLPLAVLEGMFAGNPVVATRASGIPEAVDHGVEGLLVDAGEAGPLADALGRLLSDREFAQRLGARARERALAEFTLARMTDEYEALYWS